MATIIEEEMGGTVRSWHKLSMCARKTGGKIGGWTEERIVVKIDARIGGKTDEKTEEKIDSSTGGKIAKRIADRIPAVNSVDLIGPTRLPVNMAGKGETMPG